MPGAGNQLEQLRDAQHKVEDLRYKEEQQRLAKVTQDASYCKRHAWRHRGWGEREEVADN
jgi:hypothetical protein